MKLSKSLYLGGKIIYANDERLNYYSYKELGLRCPVCGEPVHLRKGESRKPYFAHFKGTDPKQVEECNLRASAYGNSSQETESNYIENKGQRLEIFQEQFLNIITKYDSDFYKKVHTVCAIFEPQKLELTIQKCREWLISNKHQYIANCISFQFKDNASDSFLLKGKFVNEAIDYLCVESSKQLLEKIICYILYDLTLESNFNVVEICGKVAKIIICSNWEKEIYEINLQLKEVSTNRVDKTVSTTTLFKDCPYCNKTIGKSQLEKHIERVHKEYICPFCKFGDPIIDNLGKHIKDFHRDVLGNHPPTYCRSCKIFVKASKLEKHIKEFHLVLAKYFEADTLDNHNKDATRKMLKTVRKTLGEITGLGMDHGYCYAVGSQLLEYLVNDLKFDRPALLHWCKNADRNCVADVLKAIGLGLPLK